MNEYKNKTEKEFDSIPKKFIIPVIIDFETIKKLIRHGKRIINKKTGKGSR